MKAYLKLIRPKQWVKNVFVFMPLFFGGALLDGGRFAAALVAFLAFSLAASSIYCLNDLFDLEADRRHPVKCLRPIASGAVSERAARMLAAAFFVLSAATILLLSLLPAASDNAYRAGAVILFYWLLNACYCLWLKHYAIVDVCTVASGFVLRILVGGLATGIVPSNWLVLMTFLLTLFLSFAKRRDDVLHMEETGEAPRKNTSRYNREFIDQAITITAGITLVCYIMYTVSPEVVAHVHTSYLYLTTVFVLVALLRYIQLTVVDKKSGDPTKVVWHDRFTQAVVLAWGLSYLLIIYLL